VRGMDEDASRVFQVHARIPYVVTEAQKTAPLEKRADTAHPQCHSPLSATTQSFPLKNRRDGGYCKTYGR